MKVLSCVILALTTWINTVNASELPPYDEFADPKAEFAAALTKAHNTDKKILVIFGANWCPDCRSFDQQLRKGPLKTLINQEFIVVKADIGNWDKNMDFANIFGNPAKEGIPSIAIVDSGRERYYATRGRELAQARHQPADQIVEWFTLLANGTPESVALRDTF